MCKMLVNLKLLYADGPWLKLCQLLVSAEFKRLQLVYHMPLTFSRINNALVFHFCPQIKCEQYWPSEGAELYGDIEVTVTDWIEFANYTITTLQICKVNTNNLFTSKI